MSNDGVESVDVGVGVSEIGRSKGNVPAACSRSKVAPVLLSLSDRKMVEEMVA